MLVRRVLAAAIAGLWALSVSALPSWGLESTLISESADGRRLVVEVRLPVARSIPLQIDGQEFTRIEVPGTRSEGDPGTPEMCVGQQLLALPRGARAQMRILQTDFEDQGVVRLAPNPSLVASYPSGASGQQPELAMAVEERRYDPRLYAQALAVDEIVKLGEIGILRNQSVIPLEVRPLVWNATTGRLQVLRRVRVEITFVGGSGSASPGAASLAASGSYQRILGSSVLNAARGATWAVPPQRVVQRGTPLKSGLLRPGLLGEDEWKVRVRHTGTTRVPASVLLSRGFPDGSDIDRLRLVLKRYDPLTPLDPSILEIPIHIEDTDQDGLFSSGDAFLFWAEQPRDDATAGERAQRYSFDNVYWLSVVEAGTPLRMPVKTPQTGAIAGPATFPQSLHYEKDLVFDSWVYADSSELYYMLTRVPIGSTARYTAAVPGRNANSPLTICVDAQQDWLQRSFQVDIEMQSGARVLLGNHPGYAPPRFRPAQRSILCNTLPANVVEPGNITLLVTATPQSHGFTVTTPYVDNVELSYDADYVATNDAIRFNSSGVGGTVAFRVRGFSGAPLVALDVTDPKSPAWFDLAGALSADTLTVTDVLQAGSRRDYDVLANSAVPSVSSDQVEQDVADPILADLGSLPYGTFDVLVVAWDGFAQDMALQEWVAFRQSQGHRVRVVTTSDAYDAFNGGLLHYDGIYRLVENAYRNWGISALLLVGDGSEDAAHLSPFSGPNFVPARVKYFPVTASGGNGGEEYRNDMNERHYAKMDGENDNYPDLLVGRLPVGDSQELRNIIDKTLLYEQPAAGDDHLWRKRVLMLSDDEWVKRVINGDIQHRRGSAERNFFRSIDACCDIVNNAFPGDLHCVEFFMHTFSDSLFAPPFNVPEHEPWDWEAFPNPSPFTPGFEQAHSATFQENNYYIDTVTRALADSVGEGCLFLALQTHANRTQVADEAIMRRSSNKFEPQFYNNGKPFVFFGLGCHLNEFAINEEGFGANSNDALGELFMTVAQRGAVASYASTGFEFLTANYRYHKDQLWPAIFEKRWSQGLGRVAVDSDTLTAHWLLSELIAVAEITNNDVDVIDRYCFLGDPLLQLDAGTPRFQVSVDPASGSLLNGTQLVASAPGGAIDMQVIVADEQGIDSLWVEKRFAGGGIAAIDSVFISAVLDTAAQIVAKRSWKVDLSVPVDQCDFDVVVGARDVAGRVSEFRATVQFATAFLANEVAVMDGDVVDARTAFRQEIRGCQPLNEPLSIVVLLDGEAVSGVTTHKVDDSGANWDVAFELSLTPGSHQVAVQLEGQTISTRNLSVLGSLGLYNVVAFPNPFADWTRIYFEMTSSIAGGHLRVLDVNGRLVRLFDLSQPGVVQTENASPGGSVGTSLGWNFVVWDGTDRVGDRVANGVYLFELRIENSSGEALSTRDKVVLMY